MNYVCLLRDLHHRPQNKRLIKVVESATYVVVLYSFVLLTVNIFYNCLKSFMVDLVVQEALFILLVVLVSCIIPCFKHIFF